MADYYVGTGERTQGAAAARPWGFGRPMLAVADANSDGAASPRPAAFPLSVVGAAADGSLGALFTKPIYVSSGEGSRGSLLTKTVVTPAEQSAGVLLQRGATTPAEGSAGIRLVRTATVPTAEGSVGSVIYRQWLVGIGERSGGLLAERPTVRHRLSARGLYRIFNAPEYRFYRSRLGAPIEGATPFATSSSLPAIPATAFSDGTWYLSVSYFNGVLDSGFLPLGPAGETYLTLEVVSGEATGAAPAAPINSQAAVVGGGVVAVTAVYYEDGARRATQWAIAYTTAGSDPAEGNPVATVDIPGSGMAILNYPLPAVADGTTVKVRVQTRRNDGTDVAPVWVYSPAGHVLSVIVDAASPAAPAVAGCWPGQLPRE